MHSDDASVQAGGGARVAMAESAAVAAGLELFQNMCIDDQTAPGTVLSAADFGAVTSAAVSGSF